MTDFTSETVKVAFDATTGIATLLLEREGGVNKIDATFGQDLARAVDHATGLEGIKGIILATAARDFCVGADVDSMFAETDAAHIYQGTRDFNGVLRKLETAGVPVVCALTGSALGGGYEIAMACHRRIALDSGRILVGLPEVGLGLIPGAGGTQRLPRMVGIQVALEHILQGRMVRAPKALTVGLVDELAPDVDALRAAAEAWIAANPKAKQPWDTKGAKVPGPQPGTRDAEGIFSVSAAMIYKKTGGSMEAPKLALQVVQEGLRLVFDRALEVEGRVFAQLATSPRTKDIIRTFWYHRNAVRKAEGYEVGKDHGLRKIGVLGAGMMGSGLAYICANKGYEVVLKDIAEPALEGARKHVAGQLATKRHLSDEQKAEITGRITFTLDQADLKGCDLIIEAVVEDDRVKHAVTKETEPLLSANGIWASNTSAIPITHLASVSAHPERFIGLHYFSPVEKMELVEIIMGEQTSDETLARALAFSLHIGKLPVVVNDGYGFYTSRVFGTYLLEAARLVAEGHDPVLVEWAATAAGMVVPALKVFDEVTLRLGYKGMDQRRRFLGDEGPDAGIALIRTMVEDHDRLGKFHGKGFYTYEGRSRKMWEGLADLTVGRPDDTGLEYIQDRLMLRQVNEVARCIDDGVIRKLRDAEVAAIFGIGFAPGHGGPLAWMDRRGIANVVESLRDLAEECGDRYAPADVLVKMAEEGRTFFE